jgi:hypothetical protein
MALLALAGAARAQFSECVDPNEVGSEAVDSIVEGASSMFGDLPQEVCDRIVSRGYKLCVSQAKAAAKCHSRSVAAHLAMSLRQCAEVVDDEERALCKLFARENRDEELENNRIRLGAGLVTCSTIFREELEMLCLLGVL